MERDHTQTQPSTNYGPIVQTAPRQLGMAQWHAERETASVFAAQCANTESMNFGNEMNLLQQGHLAAQGADGLGFQTLICQVKEQSEDEPEQDQGQVHFNNLPDNTKNEGSPGLTQETRRSEANKGRIKPRPKSSRKKKKGRRQRQLLLRTTHADVGLEALTGGATTRDSFLEKLNPSIATTSGWKIHEIHHSL
ncbi:MAG: hypothetical protein EZS28_001030 [Streblomastix strix]|uniref:Uncharacterized protein n=1 Tax=Streblomastix strix TaxID=222440 RepID=A0A5J4X873_9EUKA|nr:MAG: hypothetical protein EZS28_001030 [Streblomastix strix]